IITYILFKLNKEKIDTADKWFLTKTILSVSEYFLVSLITISSILEASHKTHSNRYVWKYTAIEQDNFNTEKPKH
ncbi:MAG: hypothetical protein K4H23_04525, partial [Mollicutes bacterium PWAP]|nr:hypothetical protein [Mollicutes bacterium PWAP]